MRALLAVVLLSCGIAWTEALPAGPASGAQSGGAPPPNSPPTMQSIDTFPVVNDGSRPAQNQTKLRDVDRQKQIVADTQKLLKLANELNAAVEKSNKDTLSLDVIRKADEIEKLAKSLREKMKGI